MCVTSDGREEYIFSILTIIFVTQFSNLPEYKC